MNHPTTPAHPSLAGVRLLIFDFDGTLADSVPAYADIFARILGRQYGVPREKAQGLFLAAAGQEMAPRFQRALRELAGIADSDTAGLVEEFFQEVARAPLAFFPDVPPCLHALHRHGYRFAISSANRPHILQAGLAQGDLLPLVDRYLGQDPARPREVKGPAHFRALASHYSLSLPDLARQALFIGDGIHDVQIARRAGLRVVARAGTLSRQQLERAGPTLVVNDLYELLALLGLPRPQG